VVVADEAADLQGFKKKIERDTKLRKDASDRD
jgi:hypothetical protein